jgi:PIN domain nuclease of toxin-antitoxin system
MRLLLDTNIVLLIAKGGASLLPESFERAVTDAAAELFVSVASLWEIAIKSGLGKLELLIPPSELPALFTSLNIEIMNISAEHALANANPSPQTRDPFDRLLLGVCAVENLRLVTRDRVLADHPLAWRSIPVVKK